MPAPGIFPPAVGQPAGDQERRGLGEMHLCVFRVRRQDPVAHRQAFVIFASRQQQPRPVVRDPRRIRIDVERPSVKRDGVLLPTLFGQGVAEVIQRDMGIGIELQRRTVRRFRGDRVGPVRGNQTEPDMGRLLDGVPALMAEAERRRRLAAEGPVSALVPLAWKAIPRLAAAAAVLVLASVTMFYLDSGSDDPQDSFDALIYFGSGTDGQDDLVFEAIFDEDDGNG